MLARFPALLSRALLIVILSSLAGCAGSLRASQARKQFPADLDSFLYQIAAKYYSTIRICLKENAPDLLYFGPSSTVGWDAPARQQIVEAAGKCLDVLSTEFRADAPGRLDFTARYFGDKPLIYWYGSYANPDSGMWKHRNPEAGTARSYRTPAARGDFYAKELAAYASITAEPTRTIPSIGILAVGLDGLHWRGGQLGHCVTHG